MLRGAAEGANRDALARGAPMAAAHSVGWYRAPVGRPLRHFPISTGRNLRVTEWATIGGRYLVYRSAPQEFNRSWQLEH